MLGFIKLFSPQVWAYIALGLIVWTGVVAWRAEEFGYARADSAWVIKTDKQKIEAANLKIASDKIVSDLEHKNLDLNAELEKAHADAEVAIAKEHDDTISRINAGGVLVDAKGRGYCRTNVVPNNPNAVVHAEPTAVLGCELSAKTSRDLTDLSRDAAVNTDFANKCLAWAMTVPSLCKNTR